MIDLTRRQRLSLLALRQRLLMLAYTGRLRRRPLDWPEIRAGLVGFAIIVGLAYAALWVIGVLAEAAP